jgi:hypothetical protein
LKTFLSTFYIFLLCILAFSCISYNSTINTWKFKCLVDVYPIDVNPIEVYPIEAYLIGKGVVEVSGCHRLRESSERTRSVQNKGNRMTFLTPGRHITYQDILWRAFDGLLNFRLSFKSTIPAVGGFSTSSELEWLRCLTQYWRSRKISMGMGKMSSLCSAVAILTVFRDAKVEFLYFWGSNTSPTRSALDCRVFL